MSCSLSQSNAAGESPANEMGEIVMLTYRVMTPMIAVEPGPKLLFIPAEATITITGEVRGNGLVEVLYDSRRVMAFLLDIQSRAEAEKETETH